MALPPIYIISRDNLVTLINNKALDNDCILISITDMDSYDAIPIDNENIYKIKTIDFDIIDKKMGGEVIEEKKAELLCLNDHFLIKRKILKKIFHYIKKHRNKKVIIQDELGYTIAPALAVGICVLKDFEYDYILNNNNYKNKINKYYLELSIKIAEQVKYK
jgi:hypothetical protein